MTKGSARAGMLAIALITGCEGMDDVSKQQLGTLGGATLGGLAGSFFGEGSTKVAAIAVGAAIGGVIGNQIGRALDERDRAAIEQRSSRALEDAADGETVTWENPDNGNRAAMTPRDSRIVQKQVVVVREPQVAPPPTLDLVGRPYLARHDVSVRAAPNLGAPVVRQIGQAERFNAVGRVTDRNWYLISQQGRSVGYVYGNLIEPSAVTTQQQLREPIDLDDVVPADDVVVETVAARTECRTLDLEIAAQGQRDLSTFEACKAADGAWELG